MKGLPRCLRIHLPSRRCELDPWVRKIPWRRKRQPTPVFLPEKSHRQRSLVGYSPWGRRESDTTEQLTAVTFFHQWMLKPVGERVEIIGTNIFSKSLSTGASLVAQMVKNLSVMPETLVQSLGWEDPLEKGMATHPLQCSCLENLMDRGAQWATVQGVAKNQTQLSD